MNLTCQKVKFGNLTFSSKTACIQLLSTRKIYFCSSILANNHQWEMFPALEKLLTDFQREGLPKWKQMKCIELMMTLLAEDLIGNGIIIDLEMGKLNGPKVKPANVFGHLVNNVQSVLASKAKFKPLTKEPDLSSSSSNMLLDLTASNCGNGGRGKVSQKQSEPTSKSTEDNSEDSNELCSGHVGLPARP